MGTDASIDIASRLTGATTNVAGRVTGAIRDAARVTGAGFEYLLNTAMRESNLNPNAKARTSSATGLFQFIDQTWLGTMKQSGTNLGYGKYADAISQTSSGRFVVSDPEMRGEILALRKDPTANSLMAGAFANANSKFLSERLGRKPSDGELYIAHFLGASGAARFISAAQAQPDAKAADLFPRAAAVNKSIFYDRQGGARSLNQVYAGLVGRHDVIGHSRFAATNPAEPTPAAPPIASFRDVPARRTTPVVASVPVLAPAGSRTDLSASAFDPVPQTTATAFAPPERSGPMFQTLFHADQRGAVAPVVRELWGPRHAAHVGSATAVTPATDAAASAADARRNTPLDLFNFLRPSVRRPA